MSKYLKEAQMTLCYGVKIDTNRLRFIRRRVGSRRYWRLVKFIKLIKYF